MRLTRKRPALRLLAPRTIVIGTPFELRAIVDSGADIEMRGVHLDLRGTLSWIADSQWGQTWGTSPFSRASVQLRPAGTLARGQHVFGARLRIPPEFPAAHEGQALKVRWSAELRVEIPWWPDATATFFLHVVAPPRPAGPERRQLFVTHREGPVADRPYMEMSLASIQVEPGGELHGNLALSNIGAKSVRSLDFSLVAAERVPGGLGEVVHEVVTNRWRIPLESVQEAEPIFVRLQLPRNLSPGFRAAQASLSWWLDAEADVMGTRNLRLRVPLFVRNRAVLETNLAPAPSVVGSERIASLWQEVARRTDLDFQEGYLRGDIEGCRVEIRRERRDEGTRVVGTVLFPDLGIGMAMDPRMTAIVARDLNQAQFVDAGLRDGLIRCHATVATDTYIECTLDSSGQRLQPLERFTLNLTELARTLGRLRDHIPPPADLEPTIEAWARAAQRLSGRLDRAAVRIRAHCENIGLSIGIGWKPGGTPDRLRLSVRPARSLDRALHVDLELPARLPDALVDLGMDTVLASADHVTLDHERVAVQLPFDTPLDEAVGTLESMVAIVRRACGETGPYR